MNTIPQTVIDADHRLDGVAERSTEELARHRWHQCLDPDGPQHSVNAYAKAVGRDHATIRKYAKGYAEWVVMSHHNPLTDCIALAAMSAEKAEVAAAVAEVEGRPVESITHRRGDDSLANVTEQARDRATRTGTSIADAARDITERKVKARAADATRETQARQQHTLRYIAIEGHLAAAKRRLTDALNDAEDVGFNEDEMELLRDTIAQVRALLNLIDLRLAGNPDVDWDAELARLS